MRVEGKTNRRTKKQKQENSRRTQAQKLRLNIIHSSWLAGSIVVDLVVRGDGDGSGSVRKKENDKDELKLEHNYVLGIID